MGTDPAGGDNNSVTVSIGDTAAFPAPRMLPRDVPSLAGRQGEIERLTALSDTGRVVVTVIGGMGGVGKTALAVHAAHRLLPQFPEGQLYADMHGYARGQPPAEPAEVLGFFLQSLGVPAEAIPGGIADRTRMFGDALATRRILVVLDNAGSEAQVRPLLPGAGRSLILVTSRSRLPALEADERLHLDVLLGDQAVELLTRLIGPARVAKEPAAVSRVAQRCGGLPLALRIAGMILVTHPAWAVSGLEERLADERTRLARLEAGDLRVHDAFEVSYRQLAEDDARLFRLLGLGVLADFDAASLAALADVQTSHANASLGRLTDAALVAEHRPGRYSLHPLIRLFARAMSLATDDQATRDAALARMELSYEVTTGDALPGSGASRLPGVPPAVTVEESAGVQVGDHNVQLNYFYGPQSPPRIPRRPYRGPDVYEEDDSDFFFGRDDAISHVMAALSSTASGIVVVSGASGVGKSSLLRAGVLAQLGTDGLPGEPGARSWPRLLLTPGTKPLDELAVRIAPRVGMSALDARRSLVADPGQFRLLARQAALSKRPANRGLHGQAPGEPAPRQRLVLVIDQFEELFTLCRDEGERRAFIAALGGAASAAGEASALVILAVRAGYEAKCAEYPQLAAAARDHYSLLPMTGKSHALAITRPAERAGSHVDQALVDRLLKDAPGNGGALPWLSCALAKTWDAHSEGRLTLAGYEQTGGIEVALAAAAEQAYAMLAEREQDTVRWVFLRLISRFTGQAYTASPVGRADLDAGENPHDIQVILDTFATARLLTLTASTVMIGHEGLLDAWPRLQDWLASRQDLAGTPMRILVDMTDQQGETFIVVTGPDGRRSQCPVAWIGGPESRMLVAREEAGALVDPAPLADAVNHGRAAEEALSQYGALLFRAAFSTELWKRFLQVADATGQPYLEVAIRAPDGGDHTAMQSLHWEVLHDGTGYLAARNVSIVRRVPVTARPARAAETQPASGTIRVLVAFSGALTDRGTRADFGFFRRAAGQLGGSVQARVLDSAVPALLSRELETFKPDVLHLIGPDWLTAGHLLEAGQTPKVIVLTTGPVAGPVTTRLVANGVPVVIAMRSGTAADRAFMTELTRFLALGHPLVQSVSEAIHSASSPGGVRDWLLPAVFIADDVPLDERLVDGDSAGAIGDRIHRLGLDQDPEFFGRGEFTATMDRLLDGGDPLKVVLAYSPGQERSRTSLRLLRELGAHAVRLGVVPVLLGASGEDPPTGIHLLARQLGSAIHQVRLVLGLPPVRRGLQVDMAARDPGVGTRELASAIRADLDDLAGDLPPADPARAGTEIQPKVVLLCQDVDGWQGALDSFLGMLGPTGLVPGRSPVPVVLTGRLAGVLGDARDRWSGRDWFRAIPIDESLILPEDDDLRAAERAEVADEIRALVAAGQYPQAEARLAGLAAADPDETSRLRLEFGFTGLEDRDRQVIATAWKATAPGREVQHLLASDVTATLPATPDASDDAPPIAAAAQPTGTRQPPQQSGATLEQATVDLFARFFAVNPDVLVTRLRRQGSGAQYGHDVELECSVAGNPVVRCHVECKNLNRRVILDDIAGKIAQQKFHHRDGQVDHWILISPHHDAANELRGMLDSWDQLGEYPFSVQVWSPENRVREMFALEPAVYRAVYGRPPAAEEVQASAEAAEAFRQLLTPRLRLDAVWRRYVTEPESHCFVNEDARHFTALYGNHLPLWAADQHGAPLPGRMLLEEVTAWARDDSDAPMLLLADFGEGKSVFTYCLTRLLCEELRAAPDNAVLPLRISLREFSQAGSARGLLERRLREIGATYADWRRVGGQARRLAILDGFDEMSVDLSPAAITANLRGMEECLRELSGSKVLVTSRQRVLEGTRDWNRTLDRLQRPQIRRIAPGSRRQRLEYLERFATDEPKARVLAALRSLYDPIGLAAKPLFLEMIKDTLDELRENTFSEKILYDIYIDKSLKDKVELLADDDRQLYDSELAANLKGILEDIAVRLQETNGAYLYLRDYQSQDRAKIAELLWKIRDEATPAQREPYPLAAQDDAANRVSIRSLLKGVPAPAPDQWPVDFFHRSMREYFVAKAIVHALTTDTGRLRRILAPAPLVPEITHFAGTILREDPDAGALAALERLARSATISQGEEYLGGNALTLLCAAGADLSHGDWSGLRLDHARLRGADLRATLFAGSSLRYANLDNANLEEADLTGADLEGVRLEETRQVLAVTALGDQIIAAYEDQSLREWRGQPGAVWESRVVTTLSHKADRLQVTPLGRIIATGDGVLSVLDIATSETPDVRCEFRTSSRSRAAVLGEKTALFAEEGDSAGILVTWLDVLLARRLDELRTDETVTACAQVDGELYAVATPSAIRVVWPDDGTGAPRSMTLADQGVTCLALRADGNSVLLATGNAEGTVVLARVDPSGVTTRLWQRDLHTGPVTGILLDPEEQVITGGTDRSVCITPIAAMPEGDEQPPVQRLHLTLRCRNVRFEGVRPQYEQDKLRKYSAT